MVDPEITRREVISRVASGEYRNISFIHEIADSLVEDVTADILSEAAVPDLATAEADLQAGDVIHALNGKKIETVSALRDGLKKIAPGAPAVIQIERDSKYMYVTLEMD